MSKLLDRVYKQLECKNFPGLIDWVLGSKEREQLYLHVMETFNTALLLGDAEEAADRYVRVMLKFMADYEEALSKTKIKVSVEKLKGRYGQSK